MVISNGLNINFELPPEDRRLVKRIAERYALISSKEVDLLEIRMDLTACHNHGCKLDFEKLVEADNFTLVHDLIGIANHLDRETGKLKNYFLPRCALKRVAPKVKKNVQPLSRGSKKGVKRFSSI